MLQVKLMPTAWEPPTEAFVAITWALELYGTKMENTKKEIKTLQVNKKAYFNYSVLEDLEAGISLAGTEVKSLERANSLLLTHI